MTDAQVHDWGNTLMIVGTTLKGVYELYKVAKKELKTFKKKP